MILFIYFADLLIYYDADDVDVKSSRQLLSQLGRGTRLLDVITL